MKNMSSSSLSQPQASLSSVPTPTIQRLLRSYLPDELRQYQLSTASFDSADNRVESALNASSPTGSGQRNGSDLEESPRSPESLDHVHQRRLLRRVQREEIILAQKESELRFKPQIRPFQFTRGRTSFLEEVQRDLHKRQVSYDAWFEDIRKMAWAH